MKETFVVSKIYEDDFGCEERSENYEPKVIVELVDEEGSRKISRQSDSWMYQQNINEDDEVTLVDGMLKKR